MDGSQCPVAACCDAAVDLSVALNFLNLLITSATINICRTALWR
jgi:hypothetical protein